MKQQRLSPVVVETVKGINFSYNDIPLKYDEKIYQQLRNGGIDELLAKHIAHMFIRDPLQVFFLHTSSDYVMLFLFSSFQMNLVPIGKNQWEMILYELTVAMVVVIYTASA